jgi:hypothetical protein
MNPYIVCGVMSCFLCTWSYATQPSDLGTLDLKLNTRYWNDEGTAHPTLRNASPSEVGYEQSALGVELNYRSKYWANWLGMDGSLYAVTRIFDSGKPTTQLLEVQANGKLDQNFATLGQLYVKAKILDIGEMKVGRQMQDSLLLKSTMNRAVPDTFSGASAKLKLSNQVKTYISYYDQWKPRSMDSFEKLVTDNNERISYVGLIGGLYQTQNVSFSAEYLKSKNYLEKYGAILQYKLPVADNIWRLSGGAFFSRDDGALFKCGAEFDLDCIKGQEIVNRGRGYFLDLNWANHNIETGLAVSKFDGFWVEDNFSTYSDRVNVLTQDHGTNPFPTASSIGPDFSNNDETAIALRLKYDWKDKIKGLKTEAKYIYGFGAHQSNISSALEGKEQFLDLTLSYVIPWVKNMDVRYCYLNYDSRFKNGQLGEKINGMTRKDWDQHRVLINYTYQF